MHHVINIDVLLGLRTLPDNSVDAIVTDPPYELGFMGKAWDSTGIANNVDLWREALRVLKPGGHLLAFSGSRTYHRMACAIEDAGFEVRDQIMWVYGSGFPKSLDVSKAIDKAAGAEREVVGGSRWASRGGAGLSRSLVNDDNWQSGGDPITAPATDAAREWDGWGTALKPAHEPICMARKPLAGTVAANVLAHGTGGLNIDGCRVEAHDGTNTARKPSPNANAATYAQDTYSKGMLRGGTGSDIGRWPANLIHDGSDEVLAGFPAQAGAAAVKGTEASAASVGRVLNERARVAGVFHADTGSAARFFYCAKASKADRDEGLDDFEATPRANGNKWTDTDYRVASGERGEGRESGPRRNTHPTVKPTALMRYLCRLVTPPGGLVVDLFTGSGSTGKAAKLEGFRFIGFELEAEYVAIASARIAAAAC